MEQRHVVRHRQQIALGHKDVFAHPAIPAAAEIIVVLGLRVVAGVERFFARLGYKRENRYPVALAAGHAVFIDHATELVPEDQGIMVGPAFEGPRNVAAANAAGRDPHPDAGFNAESHRRGRRDGAVGLVAEDTVGFEDEGSHGTQGFGWKGGRDAAGA